MKKLLTLLSAVCLAAVLATPITASALLITDSSYLGEVVPGLPSGDQNSVDFINGLIELDPNDVGMITSGPHVNYLYRSGNAFSSLPEAKYELDPAFVQQNGNASVDLNGGYFYLLAKYGAGQTGNQMHVWVVDGLTGTITVPWTITGLAGEESGGLSHISLFNAVGTPDGGITLLLLGSALTGLAAFRRKLA